MTAGSHVLQGRSKYKKIKAIGNWRKKIKTRVPLSIHFR
jgi:hypothetical protein